MAPSIADSDIGVNKWQVQHTAFINLAIKCREPVMTAKAGAIHNKQRNFGSNCASACAGVVIFKGWVNNFLSVLNLCKSPVIYEVIALHEMAGVNLIPPV